MAPATPSQYKLEKVQEVDYAEIARLEMTVFDDDPLTVYAYGPRRHSPANIAHRTKSLVSKPSDCEVRMRKVVDPESGAIIGFSYWKFYYEPWIVNTAAEGADDTKELINGAANGSHSVIDGEVEDEAQAQAKVKTYDIWPEGANVALCEKAFMGADKIREREFAGKRHAALNILVILQSHQRRGIGKMLLRDGLDEADKHNLPCWLGSSEPGFPLYRSHGFTVDVVKAFDMQDYGGNSTEKHIIMFRPAMGKIV